MITICPGLKTPRSPKTRQPLYHISRWVWGFDVAHVVPFFSTHSSVCFIQNNYILVSSVTEYLASSAVENPGALLKTSNVWAAVPSSTLSCRELHSPLMSTKMLACARDFCKSLTDTLGFWLTWLRALAIFTDRHPRGRSATQTDCLTVDKWASRPREILCTFPIHPRQQVLISSPLKGLQTMFIWTPSWQTHGSN